MDGRLLAKARDKKEQIRRQSVKEDARRHNLVYERVPKIRMTDEQIASLMGRIAVNAIGGNTSTNDFSDKILDLQMKRAELLVENGWASDFLDGAWECSDCKDTGYINGEACKCLVVLYNKECTKNLSALMKIGNESFTTFDLTFYSDVKPPNGGKSPREQMRMVFELCRTYAARFDELDWNLLFRGRPGLGKTFLSACIARDVSNQGFSVAYETIVDAMTAFEAQKFYRDGQETEDYNSFVRRIMGCDLLILDDLGTELTTEFTRSTLYTLINTRLTSKKKTIISTNLSIVQIGKRYSPAIQSRLQGEYKLLPFVGEDIRVLRKERDFGQRM